MVLSEPGRFGLQSLDASDFQRGATTSLTQMGKLRHALNHGPGLETGFLLSPMADRPQGPNYVPFLLGLQPPQLGLALAWQARGRSCCCHCQGAQRRGRNEVSAVG